MSSTRLFLKPVAALCALMLMATAAAPSNVGAKESLQKATEKAYDMWVLADKGDLEGVIPVTEETLGYTNTAYEELRDLEEKIKPGDADPYSRSVTETADARDSLEQTIKDAKAKDSKAMFEHANKARGSLNRALDDFPKG